MEHKYYNSYEWRIVKSPSNNRDNSYETLQIFKFPTPKLYFLEIGDLSMSNDKLETILEFNPFLVFCERKSLDGISVGRRNVKSVVEVKEIIRKVEHIFGSNMSITFIQEIQYSKSSFVATAISDGKGKVYIEILEGTVDSRELTSKGADPKNISECIFWDIELAETSKYNLLKYFREIYDFCWWKKGYYELAYGILEGKLDIYFTFFSDVEMYSNILDNLSLCFEEITRTRILFSII